eukprot:INCI5918.1.p1 GENE.INCI5918.1~~INCI5918.1.p1  ORF type:complete len:810 (-),score=131.98 INCI5918.1:2235-4664(-)
MPYLLKATLLAGAASSALASSQTALVDAPYVETIPFQFVYQDSPLPRAPKWGVLPEKCCVGQVAAVADSRTLLKFDQSGTLYVASRSNTTYASKARQGDASAYSIDAVNTAGIPSGLLEDPSSRLLVDESSGAVVGVVSSTGVVGVACSLASSPACSGSATTSFNFGSIVDVAFVSSDSSFLVASATGLHRVVAGTACKVTTLQEAGDLTAVGAAPFSGTPAVSPRASGVDTAFVAGALHLETVNSATGAVTHKEWISNVTSGAGGAVDGPVSAVAFDAHAQRVLLGTENALNVIAPSLRLTRYDGREGLPYGNITALAATVTSQSSMGQLQTAESQTWIGTKKGLAVWQEGNDPPWRYLFGPRWHPGEAITDLAIHPETSTGADVLPAVVVAATDGGVVFLEQQIWTLAEKATVFEAAMPRAMRHGLTSECHLGSFGDVDGPGRVCSDSDNNGLWTAMNVAAEYMHVAVASRAARINKDKRAVVGETMSVASELFQGQSLLHNITGFKGLCARSACGPTDEQCAPGRAVDLDPACKSTPATCGLQWRNGSVAAGYGDGWVWKSDTSSDEIDGHVLALSTVAALSPDESERSLARTLLGNLVERIVDGGFNLIDWTGKPTLWGRWSPTDINDGVDYTDEHGVNALEIIANLAGGIAAAGSVEPTQLSKFQDALVNLTRAYPGPDYYGNLINLRIQVPWDENFSDDELIMLPFLSLIFVDNQAKSSMVDMDQIRDALHHVWQLVSPGRSSLWSAIALYGETGQATPRMTAAERTLASNDLLWNLRTWPMDQVRRVLLTFPKILVACLSFF